MVTNYNFVYPASSHFITVVLIFPLESINLFNSTVVWNIEEYHDKHIQSNPLELYLIYNIYDYTF